MELKLNIYKKREVVKTYTSSTYDLELGTVEDFINIIDTEKLLSGDSDAEFVGAVASLVTKGFPQLKPLLLDVFDGLTESELRHTRVPEVVRVLIDIVKYSVDEIKLMATGKNV